MRKLIRTAIIAAALVAGGLAAPAGAAIATPSTAAAPAPASLCGAYATTQFGPNVCVFTQPSGPNADTELAAIQTVVNNIADQQVPLTSQFNNDGYALLFAPGTYGSATTPLVFQAGYYTEVAGLGAVPGDTTINGQIDAFPNALDSATQCSPDYAGPNQCTGPGQGCYLQAGQTCYWANSTVNFWRSMSNLTLNVTGSPTNDYGPTPLSQQTTIGASNNCYNNNTDQWSVSQASPVRSMIINGNLNFQAYCSETNYQSNDYGSGSYVANSQISGDLDWSGNQQGIARNTTFGGTEGYVWNYVYSGDTCTGNIPAGSAEICPTQKYDNTQGSNGDQFTVLPQSPVTEEEPSLSTDASGNNASVFVPSVQQNSTGPNFASGSEAGTSVPLSNFFIANPATAVSSINAALAQGKSLILTPGVYNLNAAIVAPHPDAVIVGLGFPVLVPQTGQPAILAVSNIGVKMSGFIVDAGPVNSPALVSVGTPGPNGGPKLAEEAADPDLIQDVYFRIGGAETTPVSATVSLLDNAGYSIIDDVWAWRADHGANTSVTGPQGQVGAGWTYNQGDTGVAVTGDDVTAYGLAVEHYQKTEVLWTGQGGTNIFFQNELPYDPPSQAAWNQSATQLGYPAFEVAPNVTSFNGYGMGSYVVFIYTNATLQDSMAYEAPNNPGVKFTDAMDLFIDSTCHVNGTCPTLSQSGGLQSVIDGVGGPATAANLTHVVDVESYANGAATLP